MKKAKLTYLLSLIILVGLVLLDYAKALPFNDYVLMFIILLLALISGFSLCSISEKYMDKNKENRN